MIRGRLAKDVKLMHKANFVIITGLSGAGKSQAVKVFEDMGYFCIDNLPAPLIPKFAELCSQTNEKVDKIALVIDIRGDLFLNDLHSSLEELLRMGIQYQILFLEASDEASTNSRSAPDISSIAA